MSANAKSFEKIGLGGGCHWCTEAVFQSLIGVLSVQSGWIASTGQDSALSEGVLVKYAPGEIDLRTILEIHLLTHSSANDHSMRGKYRSAVYTFSEEQGIRVRNALEQLQQDEYSKSIVRVLEFDAFKPVDQAFENYFLTDPERPFCKTYIEPKLKKIFQSHEQYVSLRDTENATAHSKGADNAKTEP